VRFKFIHNEQGAVKSALKHYERTHQRHPYVLEKGGHDYFINLIDTIAANTDQFQIDDKFEFSFAHILCRYAKHRDQRTQIILNGFFYYNTGNFLSGFNLKWKNTVK